MSLEITALPLAFLAGMLGILSPCVWPLVPVVMGAASASRFGALALAAGLSMSFALAGTLISFMLVSLQLDPELFRYFSASLLLLVALVLLVPPLADWLAARLSAFSVLINDHTRGLERWGGQFGVGVLLGFVWLPCVGPTLGAAIALASMGQQMVLAFVTMLAFGAGTAMMLLLAGLFSRRLLQQLTPGVSVNAANGKKLLGLVLLLLALLVLSGLDKLVEAWAAGWLPDWAISL